MLAMQAVVVGLERMTLIRLSPVITLRHTGTGEELIVFGRSIPVEAGLRFVSRTVQNGIITGAEAFGDAVVRLKARVVQLLRSPQAASRPDRPMIPGQSLYYSRNV